MNTTTDELKNILEKHALWIRGDEHGVRANLCGANLCGANLCRADLSGANLCRADLRGADLCGANLRRADLRRADLYEADLYEADLSGADLSGADLSGADLYGAKNVNIPLACPEKGSFIGFKKVRAPRKNRLSSSLRSLKMQCARRLLDESADAPRQRLSRLQPKMALKWRTDMRTAPMIRSSFMK